MEEKENKSKNISESTSRDCCVCNFPKSGDFKEVISLRNSGLKVFIHKNVEVQKTTRKKSEETFILHNTGKELKRPDYIREMCQYKSKCIKCKTLVQKVRSLMDEIDDIKTDEVIGVCEYCKRSNVAKCRRCEYIVSKYLSLKNKVYQNKQARFVAWLTKVNDLLRGILDTESICKHKLFQDSHSVLELEQLLSELKSPLSQRQPEITFFPTTAAERLLSFSALCQSKEILEDILKRIHTEKSMFTSDDSLLLSSSRSSTGCVCKYFMSKKMEGRRSMEVLPQEKYYPPGLITSKEFAKSLTSDTRFRGSLDRERRSRRRPSSAEYSRKKSGYHSDVSRDGTSKERGRRYVLRKISSGSFSKQSQDSYSSDEYGKERRSIRHKYGSTRASKTDEYGKERRSKRDEYGTPRGSKRDEYGKERGSKRDDYVNDKGSKSDEYGKERRSKRDDYSSSRESKKDGNGSEKGSKRDEYGKERGSKRDEYGKEKGSKKDDYGKDKGSKSNEYGKERRSKRDEYETPRGSKRDEYEKEKGLKRDDYGKERGSTKDIPPGSIDKTPSQKSRVSEHISKEQKGKSKREFPKEEISKKRGTTKEDTKDRKLKTDKLKGDSSKREKTEKSKVIVENEDTKKSKSKVDIGKEDTTKGEETNKTKETVDKEETKGVKSKTDRLKEETTKKGKKDKTKEIFEKEDTKKYKSNVDIVKKDTTKREETSKTKETVDKEYTGEGKSKTDKLKEFPTRKDREGRTKEDIVKKDVKLGDSIELIFKVGKNKKDKLDEDVDKETKAEEDNLDEDDKGKGKTDIEEDIPKEGKKGKKDTLKEDLKMKKKSSGKKGKGETESTTHPGEKSKKLREDIIITRGGSKQKQKKKDIEVIIKDDETRKRLKNKSKSKSTPEQDKDNVSKESVSDKENEITPKSKKGKTKKESEKQEKSTTVIPIKKKKPSSEAVLLLKMMKELRMKRQKEKEAKKEKLKEFADIAPLPVIKRRVKSIVEPLVSESFVECDDYQARQIHEAIIGDQIVPFDPNFKFEKSRDHEPLLFTIMQSFPDVVLPQIEPIPPPPPPPADVKRKSLSSSSSKMKSKSKMLEELAEGTAGIVKYQLSNRKYIEDGWTVLPTTKILRKMNIYNMKLANPEFDFFKMNKKRKIMYYDTSEKLAEINSNETGKWFYRNGNIALQCYSPKEPNVKKRYLIYSSGDVKENGILLPITILGVFDQLGNAIIYDHFGNARLKYNQTEGVIIDEKIGPPGRWKWHTLNDPPVLQPVFIDSYVQERDEDLDNLIRYENEIKPEQSRITKDQNIDMIMIEFENFVKEKAHKLLQKFKPFQIRMKAVKINEHFSIRILDQASVTLIFQDTPNTLKLNLGMNLINTEIVDTETSEVSEVATPYDIIPARTESVSNIQEALNRARKYGKSIRNRMQIRSTGKKPKGVITPKNIPISGSPVKLPAY